MNASPDDILDVAVIGGGISGLTTAFVLKQAGRRVAVFEAADRVGGAITTIRDGAWRFEIGPNTVLENHERVGRLIRDVGLADAQVKAAPVAKKRFIWKAGRLEALPGGPGGFLKTGVFSTGAKLRLLREPWIRPRPADEEESIADFVRRRLGPEMLDYAVGPFVSGVYAGDPERLSMRYAVRKLWHLEQAHGSLIRGAFARRKGPAPGGTMFTFEEGLDALPRRIAERIGDVRVGTRVARVLHPEEGPFVLEIEDAEAGASPVRARQVVTAVPADVLADLLARLTSDRSRAFGEMPYAPVVVLALGFAREDVRHDLAGFGFLAPRREDLRILGCLFPSSLFAGRAPRGHVALAAFAGGTTDPDILALEDEDLRRIMLQDLDRALGLTGVPAVVHLRRWRRAIPQYELGHGRFVALAESLEQTHPGLHIGGNVLGGISVPDCIRDGAALAERITVTT